MKMETLPSAYRIDPASSVAELVQAIPGAARAFEKLGIDYCCRGKQSLREAAAHSCVALEDVVERLQVTDEVPLPTPQDPGELCAHIVRHHHTFTREALQRLAPLADKVLRVHGAAHPELKRVRDLLDLLAQDLIPHMLKEERMLFPYIAALAAGESPHAAFGSVENPLRVMHYEHDHVGTLLRALSLLTDGYRPPPDACASYAALYAGLEDLQADLHEHIHLENNLLFPAALELERRLEPR